MYSAIQNDIVNHGDLMTEASLPEFWTLHTVQNEVSFVLQLVRLCVLSKKKNKIENQKKKKVINLPFFLLSALPLYITQNRNPVFSAFLFQCQTDKKSHKLSHVTCQNVNMAVHFGIARQWRKLHFPSWWSGIKIKPFDLGDSVWMIKMQNFFLYHDWTFPF